MTRFPIATRAPSVNAPSQCGQIYVFPARRLDGFLLCVWMLAARGSGNAW